jgi:hypothetical protein
VPTTSYLVLRLLPYLLLENVLQLIIRPSGGDDLDPLKLTVGFGANVALVVFAGYQAKVLGGTHGLAMWSAWWILLLNLGLNVVEELLGLSPTVSATPLSTPLTITSSDQLSALMTANFVIVGVLALVQLISCWLLTAVGYWIAGGSRPT